MPGIAETVAVFAAGGVAAVGLIRASVRSPDRFEATVSPLASIMGSGFLVVAPLLAGIVGAEAVLVMAGLCGFAFAIGHVIRHNINEVEPTICDTDDRALAATSRAAKLLLGLSYVISVAFYLGLLAGLLVDEMGGGGSDTTKRLVASALLVTLAAIALIWGLGAVNRLERVVVVINLAMIAGLVAALMVDNIRAMGEGTWDLPAGSSPLGPTDIRQLLGVLIVVQGFEISRYQGARFSSPTRITAMRRAQLISAAIYLVFIGALTHRFGEFASGGDALLELVTIGGELTPILPVLIVGAAIGSQLSASIADADGGSGLIVEGTVNRVDGTQAVLAILTGAAVLTWVTDVDVIIAIASRCFAAYYATQIVLHVMVRRRLGYTWTSLVPALLLLAATATVALFALPAD